MHKPLTGGVVDVCTSATPHATLFVPDMYSELTVKSPDGGYFYHAAENHGCTYWLADVTVASDSNSRTYPDGILKPFPWSVSISAEAYNLPSSAAYGDVMPIVQEDCHSYRLYVRIYKKAYGETTFNLLKHWGDFQGYWNAGNCSYEKVKGDIGTTLEVLVQDPEIGVDIYRVAVTVVLRGSAQRVKVTVSQPPPA